MSLRMVLRSLTRRSWPAGVLAAGVAAVGLAAMAGCGQAVKDTSAGGSGRPASPATAARLTLCADTAAAGQIQIVHIPSVTQLPEPIKGSRKLFKIIVTDPAQVRTLARAVCRLPRMPRGTYHCGIELGGGYQLTFTATGRRWPVVTVQASGCETVTGAGQVRWTARTPGFWTVLGQVAGIRAIAHRP